jgi:outer membrane protein assembly factor BamB
VRRALLALLLVVVLVLGLAGGYALWRQRQARDVRGSSSVEFVPTTRPEIRVKAAKLGIAWPTYGFDNAHTRAVRADALRPPFRRVWLFHGGSLLEFPPAIGYGRLFVTSNAGTIWAVNTETGKRAWKFVSHRCAAASPALAFGIVFQTFLNRPPCNSARRSGLTGEVVALNVGFGKVRWRRQLGPSESSPVVAGHTVYVGDWNGDVTALDEHTGRVRWRFHTGGKIKGAVAISGRRLFVGSYDHHLYALDTRTGRRIWRASVQQRLGRLGTFYSTPTVAYGRVYLGSTDGKVYSFGAASGKLRWSHGTGGYVYASPAVWRRRVLIGSYSGRFLALDAATGDERWRFRANGPISGSATVVNGVVYFATLKKRTYALDARTGRLLWSFPDGQYTPVVADRERLYLIGHGVVYGMVPK